MTRIKICGITNINDALLGQQYGCDYMGIIFAEGSPRKISRNRALEIAKTVNREKCKLVGVFKNQPIKYVNEIALELHLDLVQLHGQENRSYVKQMNLPVIKTVEYDRANSETSKASQFILFDKAKVDLKKSTSFNKSDLNKLLPKFEREGNEFIAGGITPENLELVIDQFDPYGIDVCSGIEELPGIKNEKKLKTLMQIARKNHAISH